MSRYNIGNEYIVNALESEKLLIYHLIPRILTGINVGKYNNTKLNVTCHNPVITESIFCNKKVYNVHVDVNYFGQPDKSDIKTKPGIWLASIPRMDEDGLFTIDDNRYYTVNIQKLVNNVPICKLSKKTKGNDVECILRCENVETLESVQIRMKRSAFHPYRVMIRPKMKGKEEMDVIGCIKYMIRRDTTSSLWETVLNLLLDILGCSKTSKELIRRLVIVHRDENISDYNLFPFCIDIDENIVKYCTIGEHTIGSDCIFLCYALVKFITTRKEITRDKGQMVDDRDDFSNKIVERYPNIMGKLFRTLVMNSMSGLLCKDNSTPEIHDQLVNAIITDNWEVVKKNNKNLKISRRLELSNPLGTYVGMSEVVTLVSSHSFEVGKDSKFSSRLIHKSQKGYICMIRSTDDVDAGLRCYLASDCIISNSTKIFGGESDDIAKLKVMYLNIVIKREKEMPDTLAEFAEYVANGTMIMWLHNSVSVLVGYLECVVETLNIMKREVSPYLSWSRNFGILESRCQYGRFMHRAIVEEECNGKLVRYNYLVDSRERKRLKKNIVVEPSYFNILCYETPFMNHMPSSRTMLASKIMQKAISSLRPDSADVSTKYYLDKVPIDYKYLVYGQRELVTTSKSTGQLCGNNVIVCYTTMTGMGIEDSIIVNKSSVERGLFSTIQKTNIKWSKEKTPDITVIDYTLNVVMGTEVKEGYTMATIDYLEDGVSKTRKIKHNKPYICRVESVYIDIQSNKKSRIINDKNMVSLTITLARMKRFSTADKLSSRFGQKAVALIVNQVDMPIISNCTHNHVAKDGTIKCTNINMGPDIDIIVNPQSIFSRQTISQEISSTLGIKVLEDYATKVINVPFEGVYMDYGKTSTNKPLVNDELLNTAPYTANLIDGVTGQTREGKSMLGIEFYIVLNHMADEKIKYKGNLTRDEMTGLIQSSTGNSCVKYNWQELSAMLHGKSNSLASYIYNDTGILGYYPYCSSCNEVVESPNGICEYCEMHIDSKMQLSRAFMTTNSVINVLGGKCKISATNS